MKKRDNRKEVLALSQIIILILAIFAFAYAIGSEFKVVSAQGDDEKSYSGKDALLIVPMINSLTSSSTGAKVVAEETIPTKAVPPSWLEKVFGHVFSKTAAKGAATIAEGAFYAALIYFGARLVLGTIFPGSPELTEALSKGAGGGYFSSQLASGIFPSLGGLALTGIGVGIGILIFIFTYSKKYSKEVVFNCEIWQPDTGGANCDKCNNQGILPCSEYQCRSLGANCELANKGTSGQKCTWVNRNDATPPTMEPWQQALLSGYRYTPDNTISPPDRGVKVIYSQSANGCVPAFTPLKMGVTLNELAKCNIDVLRKANFSDMDLSLSNGLYLQNHSIVFSLPGNSSASSENVTLQNGGNYQLYVRCMDKAGNSNAGTFVFKYCVDNGPDTTAPLIAATSISNNSPIQYNQNSLGLQVYVNEPAECKWSIQDRDYDSMENSMNCATSIFEMNAQMLYKCSTNLTGLKSNVNNDFYFRCKDQPALKDTDKEGQRNINSQSYLYRVIGTRPLVITSVGPNGTIKDSTDVVRVKLTAETSAGYNDGQAICQYSDTGKEGSYIKFFSDTAMESYSHEQELGLSQGDYTYYIKCFDLGGNTDTKTVSFRVETDTTAPAVVRAFHEGNYLKIITNEPAQCVYDTIDCSYEAFGENVKGISMTSIDDKEHFTEWNPLLTFYIKCRDDYGNQPTPDQCSITARPFNQRLNG